MVDTDQRSGGYGQWVNVTGLYEWSTLSYAIEMMLSQDFMNDFVFSKIETVSGGDSGFGYGPTTMIMAVPPYGFTMIIVIHLKTRR